MQLNPRNAYLGALLTFTLILAACSSPSGSSGVWKSSAAESSSVKPAADRKDAPDFALKDADGRTVRLSDYRGQVVLLNFWATWCAPCRIEIPWFNEFERDYREQGFAVLGVSLDEAGWDVVKSFVSNIGVNYRILMGDDTTADLYGGVASLPTTFLIDREGRIASVHVGLVSKDTMAHEIRQILGT